MGYKVLAVTGVPCSGKTTFSRPLGGYLGMNVISLNELVEGGGYDCGWDAGRNTRIVDAEKLRHYVKALIDSDTIVEGLLSHRMDVTHILVLRCDPRVLEARMWGRGYDRAKIMENLEAEYLGVLLYESLKESRNVLELDNTAGADYKAVGDWLRSGGRRVVEKDWTKEFASVLESSGRPPT